MRPRREENREETSRERWRPGQKYSPRDRGRRKGENRKTQEKRTQREQGEGHTWVGGTEAAGQGQRPLRRAVSSRGRAPGDSGPARTCGLDALPSRVTPAAACPLPSQVWAAVGGAPAPSAVARRLPFPRCLERRAFPPGAVGVAVLGQPPGAGGAGVGPSGAPLPLIFLGAWLLPAFFPSHPSPRPLAFQNRAACPNYPFGRPQGTLASSRKT